MSDEIDYQLIGDDLQAVIITLDPGEMVIAEAGAMMYMQDGIVMNTTLDPNAQGGGLLNKLFQGAKRSLSGDTFFVTTFANAANRRQDVAFSSHFPGKIRPIDLREWGVTIIAQKDSFLVAARGANVTIAFTRRIGAGFFGGEGFILQRIEGDGLTFLHASGTLHEIRLAPGESLRVDKPLELDPTSKTRVKMRVGTGVFMSGTLGLPKKLSMPESSALVRLRWVSLAILALSVMLTLTVRMSPIWCARWSLKKAREPLRQSELGL